MSGKLRLGKETLFTIDGHWDDTVTMRDKKTSKEEVLWKVGMQYNLYKITYHKTIILFNDLCCR